MSRRVERHPMAGGVALRSGLWPAPGPARGVCLLLPGLGDFLEKRAPVAARLAGEGHDVLSWDWRGQGGSGRLGAHPAAAHVGSFDAYVADLARIARERVPSGRPLWAMGYSMGATVALLALRSGAIAPRALVLVSPMLAFAGPRAEPALRLAATLGAALGLARRLAPGQGRRREPMGLAPAEVPHAPHRAWLRALLAEDPARVVAGPTWGWARAALAAMAQARRVRWTDGPALILTATRETTVSLAPVPEAARRLGARARTLEGGHDLLLAAPATQERLFEEVGALLRRAGLGPAR